MSSTWGDGKDVMVMMTKTKKIAVDYWIDEENHLIFITRTSACAHAQCTMGQN